MSGLWVSVMAGWESSSTTGFSAAILCSRSSAMPEQFIGLIALVVRDYDEALAFYVGKLGFRLVEDLDVPEQKKRWVVVAPPGSGQTRLLLARAVGEEQPSRIGN